MEATKRRRGISARTEISTARQEMISSFLLIWYFYWSFDSGDACSEAHNSAFYIPSKSDKNILFIQQRRSSRSIF